MSFEACESISLMNSVPLPRFGITGAVCFEMSYFIVILFLDEIYSGQAFQFQLFQMIFEWCQILYYSYNLLIIRWL